MIAPKQSIDSYVIEFIKKWKNKTLPVINQKLNEKQSWIDLTEQFKSKKACHLTYEGIKEGKKVYGLVFKDCKGMAEKWELDKEGNIKKDPYKKPVVKVYSTSVALVPLDLVVEFISSDEILPVNKNFASPYGLEQTWVENLMVSLNLDPKKDLIFFFVTYPDEIPFQVYRFLKEIKYILEGGYLKKKGFLQLDGPQWRRYIPSDELNDASKLFLSASVEGSFDVRRLSKTIEI